MTLSRRQLLKSSLVAGSIAAVAPRMVFGGSAKRTDLVRIAPIGFGGRGKADINGMLDYEGFKLTAACDVDAKFFENVEKLGVDAKACFQDYRELFAKAADEFDGVIVATPDHMHAPIAKMAMEHGKHVYLQKPLAQDILECRKLAGLAAEKPELATQMGIQIHAHEVYRTAVSWIQQGVIGTISEIHSWSGKGWGGKQPVKAPSPIPESLNWDLYVGVSPFRDYVDGYYHRNNWRKWFAFGTGTQGDMGCHIVDPVFTATELREPTKITSFGPQPFEENFALLSHVAYEFKGTRFTTPTLKLTWYNGSLRPKKLPGLPKEVPFKNEQGVEGVKPYELPHQGSVFIGEKGTLVLPHIGMPSVYNLDASPMAKFPPMVKSTNHFHDWLDAASGKKEKCEAPFEYSGPLTETVLLGTIINRWPKLTFDWDAKKCRFVGDREEVKLANELLGPKYRTGW